MNNFIITLGKSLHLRNIYHSVYLIVGFAFLNVYVYLEKDCVNALFNILRGDVVSDQ